MPRQGVMYFAGWFQAYPEGAWHVLNPRNKPLISRILIDLEWDAVDVPISDIFEPSTLVSFTLWTDEVLEAA